MAREGLTPTLSDIDWAAPWLDPMRALAQPVAEQALALGSNARAINQAWGAELPVRMVPQADLPAGVPYEGHIWATGEVPTREGLHDFFNAVVWRHMPRTKQGLNRWQAWAIEQAGGVQGHRGPLRDGLTLFDESAALLSAPPALWDLLIDRDWKGLFVTHRELWAHAQLTLFGHATLEQLVRPFKGITAHVFRWPPELEQAGHPTASALDWDAQLGAWLQTNAAPAWLKTKPYTPLPVFGVPGWHADNANPWFYDDARVFRPARVARPVSTHALAEAPM